MSGYPYDFHENGNEIRVQNRHVPLRGKKKATEKRRDKQSALSAKIFSATSHKNTNWADYGFDSRLHPLLGTARLLRVACFLL